MCKADSIPCPFSPRPLRARHAWQLEYISWSNYTVVAIVKMDSIHSERGPSENFCKHFGKTPRESLLSHGLCFPGPSYENIALSPDINKARSSLQNLEWIVPEACCTVNGCTAAFPFDLASPYWPSDGVQLFGSCYNGEAYDKSCRHDFQTNIEG